MLDSTSRAGWLLSAFAQAVAAGAKLSDAYRGSRDCSKMATSTINANAKKLARKPALKARIEELRRGESRESRESSRSEEPTGASELTPKQERFCCLYVEKSSASEAYRLAYDVSPDTKPESIHRSAAELLANPKVTSRIEAIRAELRERSAITLDHLVEALRPLAFSDIRKVMTWGDAVPVADPKTGVVIIAHGIAIKSVTELDDYAAAMIAEISETKDGAKRVKLHDKLAAIEKLAKLLGLIKEQHEHSGSIKVEDLTPKRPSASPRSSPATASAAMPGPRRGTPSKPGESGSPRRRTPSTRRAAPKRKRPCRTGWASRGALQRTPPNHGSRASSLGVACDYLRAANEGKCNTVP
jgi:phage terminase small subunit